jgi:hypothetical protein
MVPDWLLLPGLLLDLQAAQRSTQRSSSQKLKISIPSSRVDGA